MDFHTQENVRANLNIRNWEDPTIQSQYSCSPVIKELVTSFDFAVSPMEDLGMFFRMIFDVDTAQGYGLDVWGRIVGIGRNITIEETDNYLGYYGSLLQPIDQAPFWNGTPVSNLYEMSDEGYRQLIYWKALANISTADAASLNRLVTLLMGGAPVYVLETGVMTIRLVVEAVLESYQRAIFRQYGLLAKGAAVLFEWLEVPTPVFGFAGSNLEPFDNGPFFVGEVKQIANP